MATRLEQIGAEAILVGDKEFISKMKSLSESIRNTNHELGLLEKASAAPFAALASAATVASVGVVAAVTAISGAVAAIGATSIKAGAEFERGITVVQAVSQGTRREMEDLSRTIQDLARTTVVSLNDIVEASGELARGGVEIKEQLGGALKATLDLAIASAGELGLDKAARAIATAIETFKNNGVEATDVANALTVAAQKSSISFNDIVRSFQQAAPLAPLLRIELKDLAAMIGVLGAAGLRGSDAGTSLKQAFIELLTPSKKAAELMNELGIGMFDAEGAARPFRDILLDLQRNFSDTAIAAGKMTEAQRAQALAVIFGSDAIRAAALAAINGVAQFDEFRSAMDGTGLSAANLARIMQQPLEAQVNILVNNIKVLAQSLGQGLIPALKGAVVGLVGFFQAINLDAIRLFGEAIGALVSGKGIGELVVKLGEIASPEIGVRLLQLIEVFINLRSAIVDVILPALGHLKDAILTTFVPPVSLTDFVVGTRNLSAEIQRAGLVVAAVLDLFTRLTQRLQESGRAADILKAAFVGLAALPIAGFVAFIAATGALGVAFLGLTIAIGALILNFNNIRSAIAALVTGGMNVLTDVIRATLVPAIITLGTALTVLAAVALRQAAIAFVAWSITAVNSMRSVTVAMAAVNAASIATFARSIPASLVAAQIAARTTTVAFLTMTRAILAAVISTAVAVSTAIAPIVAAITVVVLTVAILKKAWDDGWFALHGTTLRVVSSLIPIIGAIVTAIAFVAAKWHENWLGMQGVVATAVSFIVSKVSGLLNFLAGLPVIGGAFGGVGAFVSGVTDAVGQVSNAFGGLTSDVTDFRAEFDRIMSSAPDFIGLEDINSSINAAREELERLRNEVPPTAATIAGLGSTAGTTAGQVGDIGGGADKAKKGLEEALPAINGFIDALTKAIRFQSFVDAFGELGAKAIDSLIEAVVSNIDKDGAKAAEALHELIIELRKEAVPGFEELADLGITAFTRALIERTDEAIAQAVAVIQQIADAMKTAGKLTVDSFRSAFNLEGVRIALGSEGGKLMDALRTAIAEGGTKNVREVGAAAAQLIQKFRESLPPEVALDIGRQLMGALTRAIREGTAEAVAGLQDTIRELNFRAAVAKINRDTQKEIDKLVSDTTAALQKGARQAQDEMVKLINESRLSATIEHERERIKSGIDAALEDFKRLADERERLRTEAREDEDLARRRAREDADREEERGRLIIEARKKVAEQLRQQAQQGPITNPSGFTRLDAEDNELNKLKERFKLEDRERERTRAREAEDLARSRQRVRDDVVFRQQQEQELTERRRGLTIALDLFNEGIEKARFIQQLNDIRAREQEERTELNNRLADERTKLEAARDEEIDRLTQIRDFADTVFDNMFQDLVDTNSQLGELIRQLEGAGLLGGSIGGGALATFAAGGTVPGPRGQPRLIIAHGQERIIPASVAAAETRSLGTTTTSLTTSNVTYQVNAQYEVVQSPVQLSDDMLALVMLAGK